MRVATVLVGCMLLVCLGFVSLNAQAPSYDPGECPHVSQQ